MVVRRGAAAPVTGPRQERFRDFRHRVQDFHPGFVVERVVPCAAVKPRYKDKDKNVAVVFTKVVHVGDMTVSEDEPFPICIARTSWFYSLKRPSVY